jgi:hypothetical protein
MSEKAELQVIPPDKRLSDSAESIESIDHELEKKVIRKCDIHLVPILFLLFLCAFVDRPVPQLPIYLPTLLTLHQHQHRQCQDSGPHERPQDERRRLQYRTFHVLHSLHPPRSPKQHDTEEASTIGLDKCDNVLLGYVTSLAMARRRSDLAARCHHDLSRRHSVLCWSRGLPRSARSV